MGRARWAAREYDLPHFSPTRSTNSSCPLWSFLQTAQAIARQSYLWVEPHPRLLGLHQNTPSGRKVARHRGNGARAYTHSLPPHAIQAFAIRFHVGTTTHRVSVRTFLLRLRRSGECPGTTALHRPSLSSDHPKGSTRLCFGTATRLPGYRTQQAALQATVADCPSHHDPHLCRGAWVAILCCATRRWLSCDVVPYPCRVVNRHSTRIRAPPAPFAWYVLRACHMIRW
jgi:hypothetical protein